MLPYQTGTLKKMDCCFVKMTTGPDMEKPVSNAARFFNSHQTRFTVFIAFFPPGYHWTCYGCWRTQIPPWMFLLLFLQCFYWGWWFICFGGKIKALLVCPSVSIKHRTSKTTELTVDSVTNAKCNLYKKLRGFHLPESLIPLG